MDFITAGGILLCIALLWAFSALMLRLLYRLQEQVEKMRYTDLEDIRERISDLEFYQEKMIKKTEDTNRD